MPTDRRPPPPSAGYPAALRGDRAEGRRWYDAAVAAEAAGDLPAATAALATAIGHDPGNAGWHQRLGRWLLRTRQWRAAVAALQRAVELQPDRPVRHYWLGRAREQCWDYPEAVRSYAAAIELDPSRTSWASRLTAAERAAAEFRPFRGTLVAHRGRCGDHPENAIEGLAALPPYVGGVEVDVRLSRDGVPVLMHDRRVDRTTSGEGEVSELRHWRLRRMKGAGGAPVPTLAAYLDACAGRGLRQILLDIKPPVSPDGAGLTKIVQVVRRSPVADGCLLMLRDEPELALARRAAGDRVRLGWFATTSENVDERVAAAGDYRAELLLVAPGGRRYLTHRAAVGTARHAGLRAGASTINSRRALEAARRDGCDVILTDLTDQLGHYVGAVRSG